MNLIDWQRVNVFHFSRPSAFEVVAQTNTYRNQVPAKMSGQGPDMSFYIVSLVNFGLARIIGVVPVSVDRQTFTVRKSKFWQFMSALIGGTFIVCYPIVLRDIFAERRVHISGVWLITEVIQYTTTYLLTACMYIMNIFYSDAAIDYLNNGYYYCYLYERRLEPTAGERNPFLCQFAFRTIYSYFGFIYSNYIRLGCIYGRTTDTGLILIYYLPDIVIASASIRFMTSIMTQLIYYRRLNGVARSTVKAVNATSRKLPPCERKKIYSKISDRFDWLCDHHSRLQCIARDTERLLSKMLIFSIVYAFANLVSCVSRAHHQWKWPLW